MKGSKYSVLALSLFSTSLLQAHSDDVTLAVMGQCKTVEEAQEMKILPKHEEFTLCCWTDIGANRLHLNQVP